MTNIIKIIKLFIKNSSIYKKFCKFIYNLNKKFIYTKYKELFLLKFDNKSKSIIDSLLYKLSELFIIDYEENKYNEERIKMRNFTLEVVYLIYIYCKILVKNLNKILWYLI